MSSDQSSIIFILRGFFVSRVMTTPLLIIFVLCLSVSETHAQAKQFPRFEDFPVSEIFSGKPAVPKIVGSRARMFRTMLRMNAKQGPNFAGHYALATWGCGSGCKALAIIDAQTGQVRFQPSIIYILRVPFQAEESLQFRLDSRLLIVVGARNGEAVERKYFYEWASDRLRLIRSIKEFRRNKYPF
jgi:hypothetical protein